METTARRRGRRAVASMRETLDLLASGDPLLTLAVGGPPTTTDERPRPRPSWRPTDSPRSCSGRPPPTPGGRGDRPRRQDVDRLGGPGPPGDRARRRRPATPVPRARAALARRRRRRWPDAARTGWPSGRAPRPGGATARRSTPTPARSGSTPPTSSRGSGRSSRRGGSVGGPASRLEPWDERYASGGLQPGPRTTERPRSPSSAGSTTPTTPRSGADPVALGIRYDVAPRPGRARVPVAFMLDVDVPRRTGRRLDRRASNGSSRATAGRASRISASSSTRPATRSTAGRSGPGRRSPSCARRTTTLIEALGDLAAWDLYEPGLAGAPPRAGRIRSRRASGRSYADVVRDVAWSLFEIELHRAPERAPNDVWTEITGAYLGVVPHPEWSWWAIRGQLVQSPGYMVNYGLGAIVTADLRARLRELRGDWLGRRPGLVRRGQRGDLPVGRRARAERRPGGVPRPAGRRPRPSWPDLRAARPTSGRGRPASRAG